MHAKEMILTGLCLSLLAYWELDIAEIPLGLFSISHTGHPAFYTGIILLKLFLSALLLSRGLLQLAAAHTAHPLLAGISSRLTPAARF